MSVALSINDEAELARFQQFIASAHDLMASGSARTIAMATSALEVYGDIMAMDEPQTGVEGVRDTQHPCADFYSGEPHEMNRCEGDGHYLCNECRNKKAQPKDPQP